MTFSDKTIETSGQDNIVREEMHARSLDMRGYRRSDGLFEVEGRVIDRKTCDFTLNWWNRVIPAHEPIHNMGVRLVFDEQMVVHDVQTFTDAAPHVTCPDGGLALQTLKGLIIGPGWSKEVNSRLAGAKSCTHLRELLFPLATTALQTMGGLLQHKPVKVDHNGRPRLIDMCWGYAAHGEVVKKNWPQFYQPQADEDGV